MAADVFGDCGAGEPDLAAADAERADERLVDVRRVEFRGRGRLVGLAKEGPVRLFGERTELGLARAHDVRVAHSEDGPGSVVSVAGRPRLGTATAV